MYKNSHSLVKILSIILIFLIFINLIILGIIKYTYNPKKQVKKVESIQVNKKADNDSLITLLNDSDKDGKISIGDKYKYKVNDVDAFDFYVLSIENDKVNLIMDRNICEDGKIHYNEKNNYCLYAWYEEDDDNSYGPITALKKLYDATKKWTNVPDMELQYSDEKSDDTSFGYSEIKINNGISKIIGKNNIEKTIGTSTKHMKARLPMLSEVVSSELKCKFAVTASCKSFIIDNLRYKSEYPINKKNVLKTNEYNILGYWLLTSYSNFSGYAYRIYYFGSVGYDFTSIDMSNGIRPVITIPISYLKN